MAETSDGNDSPFSNRSLAVALVVLTRHMSRHDPHLQSYLTAALTHAEAAKLTSADLAMLRKLVAAVEQTRP